MSKREVDIDWPRIEQQPTAIRRIYQVARTLSEQEGRLVLLLDNFDRVFENEAIDIETIDEFRPLTLELALLVATEQPLHDLDRELAASPLFNVMTQVFLGLLDPARRAGGCSPTRMSSRASASLWMSWWR